MTTKQDLAQWAHEALRELGGSAHHVRVAELVWRDHEDDLRDSGDLLFTWQYDLRWAAHRLRKDGFIKPVEKNDGIWQLSDVRSPHP